jgi:LysM repeat protein
MGILVSPGAGQTLGGSPRSLEIQFAQARAHDFTFLATPAQVERFVKAGYLVRVRPAASLQLHGVSYPYARPQVRLFLQRLSGQYQQACGEPLVVTSLTRPQSDQPPNASSLSVHPTGMAVDIRRSDRGACRSWLEQVLASLEGSGLLEATREVSPPHYHVAVFPKPYERYVSRLTAAAAYRVRAGDSLWDIARRHDVSVDELKEENDLRSSRIYPGQVLTIPSGG